MKTFKKVIVALLFVVLIFVLYLVYNTMNFSSRQLKVEPVSPIPIAKSSIEHFSSALRIQTISYDRPEDFDSTQFQLFSTFLENTYPLADSLFKRKTFNSFSFLYQWTGTDPSLKPIILMAHLDVVPVIDKNLADWKARPFGGEIKNDTIWGRGAIDDKIGVIGIMEAVELLLREGFSPKRTIYIAFGHDEEIGGANGATAIAAYLKEQGVEAEFVMDEGGSIVQRMIPDVEKNVALIGVAEKGFVSMQLSVKLEGGHSSMPNEETAIDVVANAVVALKKNPFPAEISPPLEWFIDDIGPEMPFVNKIVFANRSIFNRLIISIYEQSAAGSALVRTTTSPTIFNSGVKDNIIPQSATATVNFRILPGSTIQSTIEHVRETIHDERISITPGSFSSEPSGLSGTTSLGYQTINKTILEVFPEVLTAPNMVIGATDSRHYREVTDNIYRFSPIYINPENVKSFHGLNERIAVTDFQDAIRFYVRIIKNSTSGR